MVYVALGAVVQGHGTKLVHYTRPDKPTQPRTIVCISKPSPIF